MLARSHGIAVGIGATGPGTAADGKTAGAQSIRKALAILRVLAVGRDQGLRLGDIVRETGFNRPTAHRILSALAEEGLVQQNAETRRYAIGHDLWLLALARRSRFPLCDLADPHLKQVCKLSGDTTLLAIPTGPDLLCVDRKLGSFPVQILALDPGGRRPLGVGAASHAILAHCAADEVEAVLAANAHRYKAFRMSGSLIREAIGKAREQGYSLNERGIIAGTKALAVAILDPAGLPVGGICVAAIARRMTPARVEELVEVMTAEARKITARLGGAVRH